MAEHAVCSASASDRWLHCTAAPRYEEQFPAGTSSYAEEGTLAHKICELYGRERFSPSGVSDFDEDFAKLKEDPLYNPEMHRTANSYTDALYKMAMGFENRPYIAFEVRVNYSDYVPEGFGTCDSVMIGGDTLRITDYKHGKGVVVSSIGNSQMRLYALGALKHFEPIFGDRIKKVVMAIVQPRVTEEITEEVLTTDELRAWGDTVRPKAQQAYTGIGAKFEPGEWCRFCRGKAQCVARAKKNTAFEDFKDCIADKKEGVNQGALTDAEISDLLIRAADLEQWYKDLQSYAQQSILNGHPIPGFKVVAGKSNRKFTDEKKVIGVLTRKAHLKTADLYEPRKLKSIAAFEEMLGKQPFTELLGAYVHKPLGKPTLVRESDKRASYSPAAADFAGVNSDG